MFFLNSVVYNANAGVVLACVQSVGCGAQRKQRDDQRDGCSGFHVCLSNLTEQLQTAFTECETREFCMHDQHEIQRGVGN